MRLLKSTGVSTSGANAVVLGRSDIVGSPVASMLRNVDATVTQCHSRTKNIPDIVCPANHIGDPFSQRFDQVKNADIVVAAIGKAEYIKGDWIKPGAVVIDVGINYVAGTCISVVTREETKP